MKRINTLLILTLMLVVGFGKIHAQVVDVCAGNDTVELHLGNYRYGLVQWQVSDDNELWRDIDGAIDTVYRFLPERPRYYRAKVRFPKCAENDYLSQVSYVQTPPRANAGPDMSIPMGTVARLCASSFKGAEGEWHIIEGEYGFIEDASNPKSGFIGGEGEYKLTWTVTNSCGSNTDTVTVRCVKMEYQPGIVYVDETDAILSDSTQLVNGEYVIVFSDPVPDIQVGSVLLGYRTPSFLRKVVSFDRNGDLFVMQTEQGQLTDILLSGALCIDPIGDAEGGSKSSVKYIDRYPTRKEMLDNPFLMRDGSTYVVKNMIPNIDEKSDDWEVTAEIEDGVLSLGIKLNLGIWNEALDGLIYEEEVSLEPNMRVGIEIENGQLKECYYGYYNAVFSHTVSLSIDEEFSALEIGESGTINSSPIQLGYPFLVGGVPITIVLDFPVSLKISAALEGLKLSYTSSTTFTSAFEYDLQTHEFYQIREKQDPVETLDDLELNGTFGVKFQLGVKLSALVAGVTGPYAELRGTFNPSLCASLLPPYHSSADLNVGVDMDLGWRFHLFKDLLEADVCFNFKFFDHTEHAPKKITKFTGDNQVYTFGSYLETPITVDVSGWFDTRLPRARVHFEPEVGGEVSESVVIADAMGRASTLWKPNSPFGRDKLRVKAYDCHGDLTAGTPIVFHAYSSATDPCINANLTVEVYHVQEDRIIPQVSGGREPYMYSTDGESYSNTQPNIQTQPGHNYTFYVQDADGCEAMTTYNEPFYDCENSGLMLSVSASGNVIIATGYFGFEPYWYSIDGINYQPTGYFTPLLDGEYTIYVRDALGCVDTKHITVSREGNLYVWISEIDGHSGTAEVRTSTSSLADRGVCWSTHHAPTVEDLHASYGNNTGPFPFTIYGLDSETTYYVRAYALDLSGTSYSEERCINPGYGTNLPEVAATGITSVTQTSAVGSGNVTYEGDSPITERGICWGTNHNPDISGEHIPCGSGIGAFTADITGLTSNTQYYARAYATNSYGTAYSEQQVEFYTGNGGSGGDDHEYVDLGLPSGLLWATCNVGANFPEENGAFFAWGETIPKDGCDWSDYQLCNGSYNTLTKYCNDPEYGFNGFTDDLTILLPEDDAATVNWGSGWRTPTKEEWDELFDNTDFSCVMQNGVNGALFSASNGHSIFLPYDYSDAFQFSGTYCSSSLKIDEPIEAWFLHFYSTQYGSYCYNDDYLRISCVSVRPVVRSDTPPQVTTYGVTYCTNSTATCGGAVVSGGGSIVLERGVCWSTNHNPTLNDYHSYAGMGEGNFKIGATGLSPATTYYVRAYATNSAGTNYGNEVSFTTLGNEGDQEYVDLGLPSGTLWATCNIGANAPEEHGDHFAWGEVSPKDCYDWNTYQYCVGGDDWQLTKYCNEQHSYAGFIDDVHILLPEDDAATVNWGEGWRMPTKEEWLELFYYSIRMDTDDGIFLIGANGNRLFLPKTGRHSGCEYSQVTKGMYWSGTRRADEYYSDDAWFTEFANAEEWGQGVPSRSNGYAVRAVRTNASICHLPKVITSEVTDFTSSSAVCNGQVVSDNGMTVIERGICWSTSRNPFVDDNHVSVGAGLGYFTVNITGLVPATTYYVRAYAISEAGTAYGNEVCFPTFGGCDNHEYVDLALPSGTLWAACNIGADVPEESGEFFAWAEILAKRAFDWYNYKYCYGTTNNYSETSTTLTKYCNDSEYGYNGFVDNLTTLLPGDDAASTNWGADWRIPANDEWEELFQNTTYNWTTQNGKEGALFTGSNGHSIFIPAAGCIWNGTHFGPDLYGYYWTNSLLPENPSKAWYSAIGSSGCSLSNGAYSSRGYGRPVRAVRSNSNPSSEIPEGAINGLFSVDEDHQVYFSQGNLQYQASSNTWKFADNQWDYVGFGNNNISSTYDGWIDLFGWATSGYNHGAVCYQPWSTSTNSSDYYAYGQGTYNLFDQTGKADWGYNAISNGGNQEHIWRTMTKEEWNYVFNNRTTTSGIRYAKARVVGVNGVILLPDNWDASVYSLNNPNQSGESYNSNVLSNYSQWDLLEQHGAVFLPAAGGRFGNEAIGYSIGTTGNYWSASYYVFEDNSANTNFGENSLLNDDLSDKCMGYSVRLVCGAGSGSGNGGGGHK